MRWRETNFEGYFVSDKGRVKGPYNKILSTRKNNKGYVTVSIKNRQRLVHRLVALAFLKQKEGCNQVNHIDGNKENNSCLNLEWCTQSHNMLHASRVLKRHIGNFTKGGYEKKGIKEYNDARKVKIKCVETKEEFESIRDIEKKIGVHAASVCRCVRGKQQTAGALHWVLLCLVLLCGCVKQVPMSSVYSCVDLTTYVNNGKTAAQVISKERICEIERLRSIGVNIGEQI